MMWCRHSLYISALLGLCYAPVDDQRNQFFFERAELKVMPNTGLQQIKYVAKSVNHSVIDYDAQISLNRTYQSLFIHAVVYRQFSSNEYRKFLFDRWEDVCKLAEEGNENLFLKISSKMFSGSTNLIRDCPFTPGIYYLTLKQFQLDRLNFGQILPSGRYRIEVTLTDGFQGRNLFFHKLYLSISDRRIEQF